MSSGPVVVTNGDAATELIRASGLPVQNIISWGDVLHEGPVPGGVAPDELRRVRAAYLVDRYGGEDDILTEFARRDAMIDELEEGDELVLWFEHDLYDQLQLIQILSRILPTTRVTISIVCRDRYITDHDLAEFSGLFESRSLVTPAAIRYAARAWRSFTSQTPVLLADFVSQGDFEMLPFVRPAIRRLLREYPDEVTGLSTLEETVLKQLRQGGPQTGAQLFRTYSGSESPVFLGDWSYFAILEDLAIQPFSLITSDRSHDGGIIGVGGCSDATYDITDIGTNVVDGAQSAIELRGIDRWIGGVHLTAERLWVRKRAASAQGVDDLRLHGPIDLTG